MDTDDGDDERQSFPEIKAKEIVERLAPAFAFLVPPEVLRAIKEETEEFLSCHPDAARMLERLGPPPIVDKSGTTECASDAPRASFERSKAGGERK